MFYQDGLTGSAWGDWANYADSPLRAEADFSQDPVTVERRWRGDSRWELPGHMKVDGMAYERSDRTLRTEGLEVDGMAPLEDVHGTSVPFTKSVNLPRIKHDQPLLTLDLLEAVLKFDR